MKDPMFYILAPFALAFGLFVVFLVVGILTGDPGRPFRMFASRPIPGSTEDKEEGVLSEEDGSERPKKDGKEH